VASAARGLTLEGIEQLSTGAALETQKNSSNAKSEMLPWSSLISGGYKVHLPLGRRVTQTRSKSV